MIGSASKLLEKLRIKQSSVQNGSPSILDNDKAISISLVTTTFNSERYLEDTIQSVINQNYPKLEYIIIDGGSTDRTVEIIRDYQSHISYWVSEADRGHHHATAKGLARTTGTIMGWINSDDILFPWTLNTIAQLFTQRPDISWVTGLASTIDEHGFYYQTKQQPAFRKESFILFDSGNIQQESTFWRRSLWKKTGNYHDDSYNYAADLELWCRFFFHSKLHTVPLPLGAWRRHTSNISHDADRQREEKAVRKRYRKLLGPKDYIVGLIQFCRDKFIAFLTPTATVQYHAKDSSY